MSFLSRLLGRTSREPRPPKRSSGAAGPSPRPAFPSLPPRPESALGFAVIDVETSGLSPQRNRVIEVAVVHTDIWGRPQREWATRVNPQGTVGPTEVHGIRQEDVASAPLFREIIPGLLGLLRGRAIVAHNAPFDTAFLGYEFGRAQWAWPEVPTFCTLGESRHFLPHIERRRLADCCAACGVRLDNAHSALGDARATAAVLQRYLQPGFGPDMLHEHTLLVGTAAGVMWPGRPGETTLHAPTLYEALPPYRGRPSYARPPAEVRSLLESVDLAAAITVHTPGALSYLHVVADALADGLVTAAEEQAISDVARAYGFDDHQRDELNHLLLTELCDEAVRDGKIQAAERKELAQVGRNLGVDGLTIKQVLAARSSERRTRLGTGLTPLPANWDLGEPLRVDDRVVFTGDCDGRRVQLEDAASAAGLRVVGSVSRKTTMLVTVGELDSRKAAAALEFETRIVHPREFEQLLRHIQPALPDPKAASSPTGNRVAEGESRTVSAAPSRVASTVDAAPAKRSKAAQPGAPQPPCTASPVDIRRWAITQGLDVGVRGRLRKEIVDAYVRAHPAQTQEKP